MEVVSNMGVAIYIREEGIVFTEVEKSHAAEKVTKVPEENGKDEVYYVTIREWAKEHILSNLIIVNAEKGSCVRMKVDLHDAYL